MSAQHSQSQLESRLQEVARATASVTPKPSRPRIGLALGGGGAKGAAHIGVLQVLEEMRVPIDCVAGTSMGALIGGSFSSGKTAEEIKDAVLAINWSETVGGQQLRSRMPIDRKLSEVNYSNSLEFGLVGGRFRLPAGFLQTQDIEDQIWDLVSTAQSVNEFDELPIPFRAVATDMIRGEMVVLGSGDLSVAMRASMALPGAFSPVRVDGKVLGDGGMTRNLPVDVSRELCADIVIAVWLSSPPPDEDDVSSALAVFSRSFDVMVGDNQNQQIALLTEKDVAIEVPMGDIRTEDFLRVAEAVELGRQAAESRRDLLARLSVPAADYSTWRQSIGHGTTEPFRVAEVRVAGTNRVNPDYIKSRIRNTGANTEVSSADISEDAQRIYALGDFDRVGYRVFGPKESQILEFQASEKAWGPNFFRFDLGLAVQDGSDLQANLRIAHDRTWVNARGGSWHNALQVGRQTIATSNFYQPIDVVQRFFVEPIIYFENNIEDVYLDSERVASYFVRQLYGQLDIGLNLGTRAQFRAGVRHGWQQAEVDTGLTVLPELARESDTSLQFQAIYDTRNSVALPTEGLFVNAEYVLSKSWFGSDLNYQLIEAVFTQSFDLGGNSLSLIAGGGMNISGDLPITQQIELGGIRTFPGLRPGELRGDEYWFAGTSYQQRLADLQPLFGNALYAGLRLQAGQVNKRFDDVDDGTLLGISASLSGKVPIGTFLLSLGYVDNGTLRLQFTLGRPVDEGSLLDAIN